MLCKKGKKRDRIVYNANLETERGNEGLERRNREE
jgi:hypothetical protein